MVKMFFELDEKKVEECGKYTVEEIYDYIDSVFAMTTITKVEKLEHGKMYYGNGNDQDLVNLFKPIFHMEQEEWFLKYSKDVIFFDNSMSANKDEFGYENVLRQVQSKYKNKVTKYA